MQQLIHQVFFPGKLQKHIIVYFGCGHLQVTVITKIITCTCLVGDSYKPSFAEPHLTYQQNVTSQTSQTCRCDGYHVQIVCGATPTGRRRSCRRTGELKMCSTQPRPPTCVLKNCLHGSYIPWSETKPWAALLGQKKRGVTLVSRLAASSISHLYCCFFSLQMIFPKSCFGSETAHVGMAQDQDAETHRDISSLAVEIPFVCGHQVS